MGFYAILFDAVERGGTDPGPARELLLGQQRSLPNPLDLRAYLDHLPIMLREGVTGAGLLVCRDGA